MRKKYVSRAGEKLDFALKYFSWQVRRKICADFGSASGGFTECLLEHGATKVYAVERGFGLLNWKLRNDPRVAVMERTNAMHVQLPEKVNLIAIDVGWTRQEKIIPNALKNLKDEGVIISLIKPHYEVGKGRLNQVDGEGIARQVLEKISLLRVRVVSFTKSPITGENGKNAEFFALLRVKNNRRHFG